MEKNCLVTKLKKSLDNNELERLGMIKLKIRPVPNDSTVGGINWVYLEVPIHYDDYTGGIKIKDSLGNVIMDGYDLKGIISADSSEEYTLFIPKYNLTWLELNCLTEFTYINDFVPLAAFKVDRVYDKYIEQYSTIDLSSLLLVKSTLKTLHVVRCKVYCPSDILRQFTNLINLVITASSFTTPINITDLELMTSLTELKFNGTIYINGRLENFAEAQWSTYNRKSGTIRVTGSDSLVTLNNTTIGDDCSIVYSENNIIISDGNRTATFDGTEWIYS